jgi:hypothetical protein
MGDDLPVHILSFQLPLFDYVKQLHDNLKSHLFFQRWPLLDQAWNQPLVRNSGEFIKVTSSIVNATVWRSFDQFNF